VVGAAAGGGARRGRASESGCGGCVRRTGLGCSRPVWCQAFRGMCECGHWAAGADCVPGEEEGAWSGRPRRPVTSVGAARRARGGRGPLAWVGPGTTSPAPPASPAPRPPGVKLPPCLAMRRTRHGIRQSQRPQEPTKGPSQ